MNIHKIRINCLKSRHIELFCSDPCCNLGVLAYWLAEEAKSASEHVNMSAVCRGILSVKTAAKTTVLSPCAWSQSARSKFHKARVPKEVFTARSVEHEKYGGDPEQPHKLHIVTRVKSTMRRPYWEKDMIKYLGLQKAHSPTIHKNTPAVNNQLKIVKHLVRIQPLRTPYGIPAEEDMANTYINSKGELIIRRLLKPVDQKEIE